MQAQQPYEGDALLLQPVHAHHLGQLHGNGLDAPPDSRARNTEAQPNRLVGFTAHDRTQHLYRLHRILAVPADLLVVSHDASSPPLMTHSLSIATFEFLRTNHQTRPGGSPRGQFSLDARGNGPVWTTLRSSAFSTIFDAAPAAGSTPAPNRARTRRTDAVSQVNNSQIFLALS